MLTGEVEVEEVEVGGEVEESEMEVKELAHPGLAAGRGLHSSAPFHPGVEPGLKLQVCFHLCWC